MEWVLVLVLAFGSGVSTTTIGGHRSKAACEKTLENITKAAEDSLGVSPLAAKEATKRSMCVQKG